jgi:anti-sigma B factor antagonist
MNSSRGSVQVCRSAERITFHVCGRVTMRESPPFKKFAEECLKWPITGIRVDLGNCTYMDSTFLGTLLFLKRAADRQYRPRFALVSPSEPCRQLLYQLGLIDVFPVDEAEPEVGEWSDVTGESDDTSAFQQCVAAAHQELADTPGKAGEVFRAVARQLSSELESPSQAGK